MLFEGGRIALDLDGPVRLGEDDKMTKASVNWEQRVNKDSGARGPGLESQLSLVV